MTAIVYQVRLRGVRAPSRMTRDVAATKNTTDRTARMYFAPTFYAPICNCLPAFTLVHMPNRGSRKPRRHPAPYARIGHNVSVQRGGGGHISALGWCRAKDDTRQSIMAGTKRIEPEVEDNLAAEASNGSHVPEGAIGPLLRERPARLAAQPLPGVVIGELVAISDSGRTPLIVYPGQAGTAALRARAVLDLHGDHVGKPVVLSFEGGDPSLPIIMGVVLTEASNPIDAAGHVEVDANGERMIVSAKEQLILRCGKASITLTKAGKVIIEGSYIVSRATGTHRIQGGSVQLN